MSIDHQLIGKSTPAQTFTVRGEDVLRFMEAADDPALQQQTPVLYAPPTFPVTFSLQIPGLDLDGSHMQLLHREQEFTYTRRLRIGEQVTCTLTVEDIRERTMRGDHMTFVVLKTMGVDSEQQPVFTAHSTLVVRQL
jgi:hypothetical protein